MNAATNLAHTRPGSAMTRNVVNFVAFQLGWFACVLGAAHAYPWLGVWVAIVIVAGNIAWSARPFAEAGFIALALLAGAAWETLLLASGALQYSAGSLLPGLPPPWILALWALFASTLNVSLGWLQGRWLLAAVLGGLSGPASYWAGARLGALNIVDPLIFVLMLAAGWAVLTPALLALARRLSGQTLRGAQ